MFYLGMLWHKGLCVCLPVQSSCVWWGLLLRVLLPLCECDETRGPFKCFPCGRKDPDLCFVLALTITAGRHVSRRHCCSKSIFTGRALWLDFVPVELFCRAMPRACARLFLACTALLQRIESRFALPGCTDAWTSLT
jgi:hypothetical protein